MGILREGKLDRVGTLAEMRHLAALSVEATFDGPVPDLSVAPEWARCRRRGKCSAARCGDRLSRC